MNQAIALGRRGALLLAHGARDPQWARPFDQVAQGLRERDAALEVRLCFLEFMAPSLVEAGQQLVALGCARIDIVPLFLGAGGHVRKDVPELHAKLAGEHPGVDWRLHPAVGESAAVVAAMADTAFACLGPRGR